MSNKPKPALTSETKQNFLSMGYTTESINLAYSKTDGDPNRMAQYLLTNCQMNPDQAQIELAKQSSLQVPATAAAAVGPLGLTKEEMDLQQAMEMSMKEQYSWQMFEPLSIQKRIRENGVPVGLRNIGNTCYVNSLLQAYFMIPQFVEAVLKFRAPPLPPDQEQMKILKENSEQAKRLNHILLVNEIQVLFSNMIMSNKKYADPTKVIQLLSKNPQIGDIGDQKDAGEFNVAFLNSLCQGFQAIADQPEQEEENKEENKEERLSSSGSKISLKKSVIEHAPRGISQTFFGELEEVVSFVENHKTQQNSNFAQFGQVMLDVDHKDLYEAWENSFYNQIDGYKPEDSEEPTRAIQELWIKQAPNVVLFQLQRVKYDLKTGSALKTNKEFKFPKEMFLDRYLKTNMETGRKIREKVEELRKKAALLTQNLQMYQVNKSQNSPLSNAFLPSILDETLNLLKRQNENPGTPAHPFSGLKLLSPFSLNIPNQKLDQVQKVLIGMKETIEQQISTLEEQLKVIKQEINIAYKTIQKTPYDLYGVLVHDGQSAEYGHYYAFIYDSEMQKWRKYNDMNVTEVTEEEVFAESEGGSTSGKSAYCLLYQKRKEEKHPLPPSVGSSMLIRSFSIQSEDVKDDIGQEYSNDYYNQLVPLNIAEQIKEENKKLALELQQFKNKQVVDQIHEMFKLKLAKMKNLAEKHKSKPSQFKMQFLSFPLFLFIDKQREFFSKWVVLNQIVKQVHPQNLGLKELEILRGPYWDGLSSLKSQYPTEIPDLVLFASQEQTLKDDCVEYYLKLQQAMYNMLTFKAILEERWEQALRTGAKGSLLNQKAKEKNVKINKSLCKDSAKVLLLFLCSETSRMLQEKNFNKLQEFGNYLSFGLHFLPENDSHRKVIEDKMKKHLEKNSEFFGGEEGKNAYEALMLKGQGHSQDNDPFESWSNLTDELKVWNPKCSPTYQEALQEWRDDWSEEDLCILEGKLKDAFLDRFKKFVDCHKKLSADKWKLEDYYALEKDLGIEE